MTKPRVKQQSAGQGGSELSNLAGLSASDLLSLGTIESGGQAYQNDDQMVISKGISDDYKLKVGDQMVYQDLSGKQYKFTIYWHLR